ncbi:kynureninase [Candidatus Bathyarchaeota archaeon]|nr:kynureninase [Candidatus Bathyarchaeota archaeon]MBS7630891.1 kynureninase [Candidatus Bathyarchaeota archaeon]
MDRKDFSSSEEFALKLDSFDPLAEFRSRFYQIPGSIYMDGNSLGLLSKDAEETLLRVLDEWKTLGIGGWSRGNPPWISYAEHLGRLESRLVGAEPEEVVVSGSTTVNLHTLVATFFKPEGERRKILADVLNFPSDLYAIDAQIRLKGGNSRRDLVLVESRDGHIIDEDDVIDAMSEEISVAVLPSVLYRSGQLLDMERLTREAHERGIIIGFDCSHSVGVVPHYFDKWGVDFAFWCNYKYMNGGPGATASLYVNKRHFGERPGLAGWFGNDRSTMFNMDKAFDPAKDASAWQIGTTFMLSTAPIEGSLRIMLEAGIEKIREKSLKITGYLMSLIDEMLSWEPYNYSIVTPREPERRGGHVGVGHEEAYRISEALKARGVIPDFRPPNIIRLAPVPLYVSYHEVWQVAQHLKEIIDNREYERYPKQRGIVT